MTLVVHRDVVIAAAPDAVWQYVAQPGDWPNWFHALARVDLTPPGELGSWSVATVYPKRGPSLTFRMTSYVARREWTWVARLLWFDLNCRQTVDAENDGTRIVLHAELAGPGERLGALLFRRLATRTLDRALRRLARELGQAPPAQTGSG